MITTLSRLSPLSRLAPLRRVPFWTQALALCALFAVVGVAALDDYGVASDENIQRRIARANADYIASGNIDGLYAIDYRYYGVAFEMPLLLAERALGLQDSRYIYLTRHLLTHLFFIAGGFACGMLAYRMVGSRWVALLAMSLFLLHPRLYAHSFFNSKDIPFAAMFAMALYLSHRAFRKDTLGAFLLCGVGVGLAINLRPFGLMLPPMILAMRALDLWQAGREERRRVLITSAAFLAAALGMAYIVHPYYWENPLRLFEGAQALSQHYFVKQNLFMGESYPADAVPWNYIPVWFAITAPPLTLLMGAVGCAAACWQAIARPLAALRDREIRFRILLIGCIALPVAAAIILQTGIYNDWRHMYFLWGPFCLLAAVGVHRLANDSVGRVWKIGARLPGWDRGGALRRALAYGAAGVGLITTATAMAALHPHEYVYFNALVDTRTPGALGKRYEMDYWRMARHQSLEYLLAHYPDDALRVSTATRAALILPKSDRARIVHSRAPDADFYFNTRRYYQGDTPDPPPPFHSIEAYGSAISVVLAPNSDAYRDRYRAEYNDIEANGDLLARSAFDIYAHNGALRYLSANCAPLLADAAPADPGVFLHIIPIDPADLPADSRERGFENRDFRIVGNDGDAFFTHTAFFDGKCVIRMPLPDYPIARIITWQKAAARGGDEWRADINLVARAAAKTVYAGIAAGDYGLPAAQSDFDVYLSGNSLAYLKEPCAQGDADAGFFLLHIFPADSADLPAYRREYGFENKDFWFADHGAYVGDKCVAMLDLPDYAIERIRTGQNATVRDGDKWSVDVNPAAHAAAQALYESVAAGDYGLPMAQSDFDMYLSGNGLAYIKENCEAGDVDARFFLHIIPAEPADLPPDWREHGFENRDFWFADHGAYAGDICLVERELPGYGIERIRTGQFVSGEGRVWGAEFAVGQ